MDNYFDFASQWGVAIPIIQRDYVQGANINYEKRDAFMDELFNALLDDKPYQIDFIYGSTEAPGKSNESTTYFQPVDGQQRLTTLWLIGWILNQKVKGKYSDQLKPLTYTTRPSTEQFCSCLDKFSLPENYESISKHIKEVPGWFTKSWLLDPSIMAMLDFLDQADAMLESFNEQNVEEMAKNFFSKSSPIVFEHLDMHALNLNDDLYIKMNARGKMLTSFENWKAEFEGFLKKVFPEVKYEYGKIEGDDETPTLDKYFEYAIEHQWCDLLWPMAYEKWSALTEGQRRQTIYPRIDEAFMNLLDFVSKFLFYADIKDVDKKAEETKTKASELYSAKINKSRIDVYNSIDNVTTLFRFIDTLVTIFRENQGFQLFFDRLFINTKDKGILDKTRVNLYDIKSTDLVTLCLNSELDNWAEVMLWAVIQWVLYHPEDLTKEADLTIMTDFLRIIMGWIRGRRQRLAKELNVAMNFRYDDYREVKEIIATLVQSGSVFDALAKTKQKSLEHEREKGELYGTPKFDIIRQLSTCRELYFCFNILLPSIKSVTNLQDYIQRFYQWESMGDTARIQALNGYGFHGVRTFNSNSFFFYGNIDKWDYIFAMAKDDKDFDNVQNAFSCMMEQKPKLQFNPSELAYYIDKYPDFVSARYQGEKYHYFHHRPNHEFEVWALKSYSTNPILGYNVDPYAYTVGKIFRGNLVLYAESWNSEHGYLWVKTTNSEKSGFSLECVDKGWIVLPRDKRNGSYKKLVSRFLVTEVDETYTISDPQGKFHFQNNILLDIDGKDRIETAIKFLEEVDI
ncbi:MAG: DUF262 domain-containing protein [Bacteroidales bacterium]|nr:DUF262 domain-containing protein [Bacteroidales bacterium]